METEGKVPLQIIKLLQEMEEAPGYKDDKILQHAIEWCQKEADRMGISYQEYIMIHVHKNRGNYALAKEIENSGT